MDFAHSIGNRAAGLTFSVLLLAAPGCGAGERDDFVRWASEHAVVLESFDPSFPADDLAPLRGVVEGARVVALGESRHDLREQFLMKSRIVRYLVREMGFTRFVLEEGLPYGVVIDRYVTDGEGNAADVLAGAGGWFGWDTEEMLDLLEWMRDWNEEAPEDRKVRFFGCDVGYPRIGLEHALAYLGRVDPDHAAEIASAPLGRDLFHDWMWERSLRSFAALDGAEREEIVSNLSSLADRLEERRDEYVSKSSLDEWRWNHRYVVVARDGARVFTSATREKGGIIRDEAMAVHLEWYLREIGPDDRAIFWAHDTHVLEDSFFIPSMVSAPVAPTGLYLDRFFGDGYLSIGFAFEKGRFVRLKQDGVRIFPPAGPNTVDGALAAAGPDIFLLDLRDLSAGSRAAAWPAAPRRMQGQDRLFRTRPSRAFDALLFIRDITRTRPNPGALERFLEIRGGP